MFFKIRFAGDEGAKGSGNPDDQNQDDKTKKDDKGSGNPDDLGDDDKQDFDQLPTWAQKQIKDLRKENATHRNNLKTTNDRLDKFEKGFKSMFGEEDDNSDPVAKLQSAQTNLEAVATRNAILEIGIQHGVSGSENMEYFEFLMSKHLNSLQEGEEMSDEDLEAIVAKCSGSKGQGPANSSTGDNGKGKAPDKKSGETTQEEFNKMTIVEKTRLYQKNPDLYNKLMGRN